MTWQMIAARQWHLHLEWVSSSNNLSDRVSRHDTSWIDTERWAELQPDLSEFYAIICRSANDENYAIHQAKDDLMTLHYTIPSTTRHPPCCIGQCGEGGPKMVESGPPSANTSDEASTQPKAKRMQLQSEICT